MSETDNWGVIVMPVGKYQGRTIEEIPDYYINWLAQNWRGEEICKAADLELAYRKQWDIKVTEDPVGTKHPIPQRSRDDREDRGYEDSVPSGSGTRGYPDEDIPF